MENCCATFCITDIDQLSQHHHKNCDNYKTKKYPYLFYYEEACDAFIPAPEEIDGILSIEDMEENEETEIRFKRFDLTDEEFDNLPDD